MSMLSYSLLLQTPDLWREFLDTSLQRGSTINYITSPFSDPKLFAIVIFLFIILVFAAAVIAKRDFTRASLTRAAIFSFMIGGAVFSLRMDANWLSMFKGDYARFSGKETDERVVTLTGMDLKRFMEFAKRVIPPGEKIREVENNPYDLTYTLTKLGNYYLLPILTSSGGRFVWVYDFTDYSYDPSTGALRVYDSYFTGRPYATYRPGAYIFEITGGG